MLILQYKPKNTYLGAILLSFIRKNVRSKLGHTLWATEGLQVIKPLPGDMKALQVTDNPLPQGIMGLTECLTEA